MFIVVSQRLLLFWYYAFYAVYYSKLLTWGVLEIPTVEQKNFCQQKFFFQNLLFMYHSLFVGNKL